MEESILRSTKEVLGVAQSYTVFDQTIIFHINSAFSTLHQLGVGQDQGFAISDENNVWSDFVLAPDTEASLSMVKTYVFLRVRMLFDPPTTSFLLDAMSKQIQEHEWRLNVAREFKLPEEVTP